jgi:guanylate kinase
LRNRKTDSEDVIGKRLAKAQKELGYARFFDQIIINDRLDEAIRETENVLNKFLND